MRKWLLILAWFGVYALILEPVTLLSFALMWIVPVLAILTIDYNLHN